MTAFFLALFVSWTASAADKTFVYCSESAPNTFNPQLATDGITMNASSRMLFNRLVEFEPGSTRLMPGLAESWEISKSGRVYTFHLRKDVWFHSTAFFKPTRPMNADDVLFSFNRMRLKDHPFYKIDGGVYEYFQSMGLPDLIDDIVKLDEHTVRFSLTRPESPFLADMALSYAVIQSKEYGDQLMKQKTPSRIDSEPIGTGPFIFKRYVKDMVIHYEANPKYFRGPAKLSKVTFLIVPDARERFQKLKSGECQLIAEPSPADLKAMKALSNVQVLSDPGANIGFMYINVKKKPFDNLKVRLALAHALNIPAYVSDIFQGTAVPAKTIVPPNVWGSNDHIALYDYNVEKAKTLLAEAGFPKGFDTELWTFPISRPYNPDSTKMAQLMQEDLAKVGIRVTLVTYDWPVYLEKLRKGEHSLALGGWVTDNGDPDNFLDMLLGCQAVRGGSNDSQWCYAPYEQLIMGAKLMSDVAERAKLYMKAQEIVHAQVPIVPISNGVVFRALSKRVIGYKISPLGDEDFYPLDLQ